MRVSVVGAGLGGLCLAQGLRRAGIEVDVYERDPAITARFQGYRLMLNPAGLEALRGCLPSRWHPLLGAIVGDAFAGRLVLDPQLNQIGELGPRGPGSWSTGTCSAHLLLTGLNVHTGAALTGYDVLADGQVTGSRTTTRSSPTCSSALTASARLYARSRPRGPPRPTPASGSSSAAPR